MTPPERAARTGRGRATALGILILIWLLGAAVLQLGSLAQARKLARLEAQERELAAAAQEVRTLRHRAAVLARHLDRSHSALECWREVAVRLPAGVNLTSFSYRASDALEVDGEAADVAPIYDFKKWLDESKLFARATLAHTRRNVNGQRDLFELTLKLEGGKQ